MTLFPRRIVHLSTLHRPRDNRIFNKECRALAMAGWDVWLVIPQSGDDVIDDVKISGLKPRRSRVQRLLSQREAWQRLNQLRPQLLHIHDPELIPMAWLWKLLRRGRVVYDAHEDLPAQAMGKDYIPALLRPLVRLAARVLDRLADRFDGVISATPSISRAFRNVNSAIVHNYPWLSDYPQPSNESREPGLVVYIGGITRARMFATMAETVLAVPGARLELAGPISPDSVEDVQEAILTSGRIRHHGTIPISEMAQFLNRAQVGLVFMTPIPNHVESLPNKLFEYMASAVPFLATDFPFWEDLLGKRNAGAFADTGSVEMTSRVLADLLANPELSQLGRNGRKAVEEEFNFDADVPELLRVVNQAIAGCDPQHR